jgi:hypothetical protein
VRRGKLRSARPCRSRGHCIPLYLGAEYDPSCPAEQVDERGNRAAILAAARQVDIGKAVRGCPESPARRTDHAR